VIAEVLLDGPRAARLRADLSSPIDLSSPVDFDDGGERAFGLPPATRAPFVAGAFVGDVRQGGSVNCEVLRLSPHGDGTHTEGVGHLLQERVWVDDVAPRALLLARVVTVEPTTLRSSGDAYAGCHADDDRVVTRAALAAVWPQGAASALEIRTRAPGTAVGDARARSKLSRSELSRSGLASHSPPYLTDDAARLLRERAIDHVLIDLPSLDRDDDGGALSAHRIFFGLLPAQTTLHEAGDDGAAIRSRTVTELCRVPAHATDGLYLLSLGVAPLFSDAAPSRPLLFELSPLADR